MPTYPHQCFSLPPRPDLAHLKHQAADLRAACAAGDAETVARVGRLLPRRNRAPTGAALRLSVANALFALARQYGFASWPALKQHVESLRAAEGVADVHFDAAVQAVITGDAAALSTLLREHRPLARARSPAEHRCTLLHYTAANGIEMHLQKTPPNAVAICRLLLAAGSEVDALAETYGGGSAQTTLCLLVSSVHPHRAGVQAELVRVLCEYGAVVDGVGHDSAPLVTAIAFGYPAAAKMLVTCGARVNTLLTAAALGDEALVVQFLANLDDPELLKRERRLPYARLAESPQQVLDRAFFFACGHRQLNVARRLADAGADVAARGTEDFTALHSAAARGDWDMMTFLLERGAPLEARNRYGGTVLGQTCWFALHHPYADVDYAAVVEFLLRAGADARAAGPRPLGVTAIDALLDGAAPRS